MKRFQHLLLILFLSFTGISYLAAINSPPSVIEKYTTENDGVIKMYVNVIGHVKNPGTYLVYDGIDLMSVLSVAGGYINGADISNIKIYKYNGINQSVDLDKLLQNGTLANSVKLKPNDTVFVKEKITSRIFNSSNLPSVLLGILNILLTIDRTN